MTRRPGTPLLVTGLTLFLLLLFLALAGPALSPNDPLTTRVSRALEAPSPEFPLGTDAAGRCILSRLLAGSRVTLGAALLVEALVFLIGTTVGLCAGFMGGVLDSVAVTVIDILFAFPALILALVIAGLAGGGLTNLVAAFSAVYWVEHARLARSLVRAEREKDYAISARALGAKRARIMRVHILPNILPPLLVNASLNMAQLVIGISSMSFLGFGVKPPAPEWGMLISEGRAYMRENPRMMAAAVLCVCAAAACFQFIAEGLRDALDVRTGRG